MKFTAPFITAIGILLLGAVSQSYLHAQPTHAITFTAELNRGQSYVREIAPGLYFYLKPIEQGWRITISPTEICNPPSAELKDYRDDYIYVVTPPFRFRNAQALSTEYGMPAREAVGFPRTFQFVTNCPAFLAELERVHHVLWPGTVGPEQLEASRDRLGKDADGSGHLEILDSKVTDPGTDVGEIEWIKFRVDLELPTQE